MRQDFLVGLGLLAASFVPPVILSVAFPLSGERDLISIVGTIVVAYPFSLAAMVLLGLPLLLIGHLFGLVNWATAIVGGFLVGAAVAIIVALPGTAGTAPILIYGLIGSAAALVFWWFLHLAVKSTTVE